MPYVLLFLFALSMTAFSSLFISGDTAVTIRLEGKDAVYPVEIMQKNGLHPIGKRGAIAGDMGISISVASLSGNVGRCFVPWIRNQWNRFYFRLDTVAALKHEYLKLHFLSHGLPAANSLERFPYSIRFGLIKPANSDAVSLFVQEWISKDLTDSFPSLLYPIEVGSSYCLESKIDLIGGDSIALSFFVNNVLFGSSHRFFLNDSQKQSEWLAFYKVDTTLLYLPGTLFSPPVCRISIDDIVVSDKKIAPIPPMPSGFREEIDIISPSWDDRNFIPAYNKSVLSWDSAQISYISETIRQAELQLFSGESLNFPIYHVILSDPSEFYRQVIPFPLDSGLYKCRMRYQNNYMEWGNWCAINVFSVNRKRNSSVIIKDLTVHPTKIRAGNWFDVAVRLRSDSIKLHNGYLLIFMNDSTNTWGHPDNKGGRLSPTNGYVFNISFTNGKPKAMIMNGGLEDKHHPFFDTGSISIVVESLGVKLDIR